MAPPLAGRRGLAATSPVPAPRTLTLRRVVVTALFVAAILAGALVGVFFAFESDLPQVTSLEDFQPNIITQVFASNGNILGEFAIEKRVVVEFRDIPPVLRNAIVAVEDEDFWKHIGINPWRIPGAALANLRSGRRGRGFSTLTMQLGAVPAPEAYERKIREVILAFQIEKLEAEEKSLAATATRYCFGHGDSGVKAASRFYYGKAVKDLALPEAALIARHRPEPGTPEPHRAPGPGHPEAQPRPRAHGRREVRDPRGGGGGQGRAARAAPAQGPAFDRTPLPPEVREYLERDTAASASTRAACGSTRPSTPGCSRPASGRCATGCARSTAARGASSFPRRAS